MNLDRLWQLSYNSPTIDILRNSKYGIPMIQAVHLVGLTMLLGVTVILNLRLLGIGMRRFSLPSLSAELWRWAKVGLLAMIVSGFFVFLPDPARYAANRSFQIKMIVLIAAIVYQFTVFKRAVQHEPAENKHSAWIAVCSLILWFGVGWAGRGIAFLG